jgi:hypothetical protein
MVDHGDIYKVVDEICWEREKNGSYKGNSHHLSQEITEAVMKVIMEKVKGPIVQKTEQRKGNV